jgi:folate-dependent phosphoribosylglycinamide formyltransferase PurN
MLNIPYRVVPHEDAVDTLRKYDITLGVIGGARILPRDVIEACDAGIVNMHPGPLPECGGLNAVIKTVVAGACPIVTAHLIDERVDRGIELMRYADAVKSDDTLESITERVYALQVEIVADAVRIALARHHGVDFSQAIGDGDVVQIPDEGLNDIVAAYIQRMSVPHD